jgi:hypothetical protein
VGNKVALALLALTASIVVGACGGTQEAADLAGTSTPTGPTPAKQRHTDPRKSCDAQGINSTQLGIGACTENGVQYVVANYGGIVRLKSIAVAIIGVDVAPADRSRSGRTATPQRDAFLRFKVQVQNRDSVPRRFSFGQTMLGIGASNYLERTEVERKVHAESLANAGTMQPGETLRGDVLFDITELDYQELQRKGRFFVWNFGDRASAQISRAIGQLGQIRLYAGEAAPPQRQRG